MDRLQEYEYHAYAPLVSRQHIVSGKRGIATHHPGITNDVRLLSPTWRYNWYPDVPIVAGVESVPMVYSPDVLRRILIGEYILGGNSQYIMGFNEPDRPDQANVPPEDAILPWLILEMLYPDRLLVSPAPSHEHPEWLVEFYDAFTIAVGRPPRFAALAIHCYYVNTVDGCKEVFEQVIAYANDWDVPGVWVTEFGPVCSAQDFNADLSAAESRELLRWLEAQPEITRYSWFPTRLDGSEYWRPDLRDWAVLVDEHGLTRWGNIYITATK